MAQKTQIQASQSLENRDYIVANVEFGQRLANGKCGHVGICNVSDASLPNDAPLPRYRRCRQAVAHIKANHEGRPVFFFPKVKMAPCTQRAFFRSHTFMVTEAFELPLQWQSPLPQLRAFILEPGNYIIEKYDAGFMIRF
jgi:hypothetical protein